MQLPLNCEQHTHVGYGTSKDVPCPWCEIERQTAAILHLATLPLEYVDVRNLTWRLHLHWSDQGWAYGYGAFGTSYELMSTRSLAEAVENLSKIVEQIKSADERLRSQMPLAENCRLRAP